MLLCASFAHAQSGVITGYAGTAQCYVLTDSVPGTPSCVHRASVACVVGSVGYVGGVASYNAPLAFPLAIQLYQRPSQTPSGVLTVGQIPSIAGAPVQVGLNGTVTTWVLSAPMWGGTCTEPTTLPLIDSHALARFCRSNPTVPACRG
jgi:hypothetical protein